MSGKQTPSQQTAQPLTVRTATPDQHRFPDIEAIDSVMLKDGSRVRKEATHIRVRNRHTGDFHHDGVTIRTHRKKQGEWEEDEDHSIGLEGEDEIGRLSDFLLAVRNQVLPGSPSQYVVMAAPVGGDAQALQTTLNKLTASGKADVLADVLEQSTRDSNLLRVIIERAERDPQLFADAAAALRFAQYRAAVDKLKGLIDSSALEGLFQSLLELHPWMFGSEYSELLDRRRWSRDDHQDFMLRRTTDSYIELIEIKTPLDGRCPFIYDSSHNTYYPSAELSQVVGQVLTYVEELEADRDSILRKDTEDTCKIRAKVIIGRDGKAGQMQALRRYNGHLHRVEIMTFDQLHRIAAGVVAYLGGALSQT